MGTRCQMRIIGVHNQEHWFYRHWDGYPDGAMPAIRAFMKAVEEGRVRRNADQAGAWFLIITNAHEGQLKPEHINNAHGPSDHNDLLLIQTCQKERHGDIEFFYTIDMRDGTVTIEDLREGTVEQEHFDLDKAPA